VTERRFRIVSGLVAMVLAVAAVAFGIEVGNGALKSRYQLVATFTAAGQGLQARSDVKVHGVDIGRVTSVKLVGGRAKVTMEIDASQKVPVDAHAVIRPKTLFGEKFVDIDPGRAETTGPFLTKHGVITHTLGGFELEQVLADAYPILKAIKPEELLVVLDELAKGGQGEGPAINRQIQNWEALANVQAAHNADTDQFLRDLALLSAELDQRSGDIVGGAQALNGALPVLSDHGDQLAAVLDQTSRLSADLADVLQANRPFLEKSVTEGGKSIQTLADRSKQIGPLIVGVREYLQLQAEVVRIPFGDGTLMAAVKLVLGEDCPTGRNVAAGGCLGPGTSASGASGAAASPAAGSGGQAGTPGRPGGPTLLPPIAPVPPLTGTAALTQLIGGLVE
jgi:phospholipid/cholesterol/gamma-HCH transport system substrate-binding protein